MTSTIDEIAVPCPDLDARLASARLLRRVWYRETTDSTQDDARRCGLGHGEVIMAGHQRRGRGQPGRIWVDGGHDAVLLTLVLEAGSSPAGVAWRVYESGLSGVVGVGVAAAARRLGVRDAGLKWPNDVVTPRGKLAGILVERAAARYLVGIGVNVLEGDAAAAPGLARVSLEGEGGCADLAEARAAVLIEVDRALAGSPEVVAAAYASADVLTGTMRRLRLHGRVVTGRIEGVDLGRGVCVSTAGERGRWYPPGAVSLGGAGHSTA